MPRLPTGLRLALVGVAFGCPFGCNTLLDNKVPKGDESDAVTGSDGGPAGSGSAGAAGASDEAGASGGSGTSGETAEAGASGAAGSTMPGGKDLDVDAGDPPGASCPTVRTVCAPETVQREERWCGSCDLGRQQRTRACAADGCGYVDWTAWGECHLPALECEPNATKTEMASCGPCDSGVKAVTRTCTDKCVWSEPTDGVCEQDETRCRPDEQQPMARVVCGSMCGTAPVKTVCTADCRWAEPVRGECTGEGVCAVGATRNVDTSTACGPCGKGQQVQHQTCNASCAWATSSTTCALPSNVCAPEGYEGSQGWHCVGNGQREWCYVATESAALRCTWTGGRESYSGCL